LIHIARTTTLDLLKRLIRIPSVNPAIEDGKGEEEIATFIAEWFKRTRLFKVFEQKVSKRRFNVVVTLEGKGRGNSLMLNGHMETVGTSAMTVKPFDPLVRNAMAYGRASCDMKGSIAAMMSAMVALAKWKKELAGDVLFTAVVDEEHMSIGTSELVKRFRADAAILVNQAEIPTCVFGPGDIKVAPSPNEYIRLKDVVTAARIYAETAWAYCSKDEPS